jgi:hypothetical protein
MLPPPFPHTSSLHLCPDAPPGQSFPNVLLPQLFPNVLL